MMPGWACTFSGSMDVRRLAIQDLLAVRLFSLPRRLEASSGGAEHRDCKRLFGPTCRRPLNGIRADMPPEGENQLAPCPASRERPARPQSRESKGYGT